MAPSTSIPIKQKKHKKSFEVGHFDPTVEPVGHRVAIEIAEIVFYSFFFSISTLLQEVMWRNVAQLPDFKVLGGSSRRRRGDVRGRNVEGERQERVNYSYMEEKP